MAANFGGDFWREHGDFTAWGKPVWLGAFFGMWTSGVQNQLKRAKDGVEDVPFQG